MKTETTIKATQDKIEKGEYRFSDHTMKRMIKKSIDRHEVEEALLGGEINVEYPDVGIGNRNGSTEIFWRKQRLFQVRPHDFNS